MIDNFHNELRNNPRLRWGIALIIGIAWLYGILLLQESLQEQEQQHRATVHALSRLRAQLAQPEWIARAAQSKELSMQMEGGLWQAPTSGLAQAAFQDWLKAAAIKADTAHSQITVLVQDEAVTSANNQNASIAMPYNLWKIKAKLGFDFTSATLFELMRKIDNHEKLIIVDTLNIQKEPIPRVEMELTAYFLKMDNLATKQNVNRLSL